MTFDSETHTTTISHLNHEGRGVAQIEGKVTFIQNALPQETVSFKYTKRHKNFDEGLALEILDNPNAERVTPACPHVSHCAGCSLQHLSTQGQIKLKETTLKEHFKHFAELTLDDVEPAIHKNSYHYRHKARLSVKDVLKKNKVLVGFHEHNGRYVSDIQSCSILAKPMNDKILVLADQISKLSVRAFIPQIEVAISDQELALVFRHVQPLTQEDLFSLINFAKEEQVSVYLQPSAKDKATETLLFSLFPENLKKSESSTLLKLWPQDGLNHRARSSKICTIKQSLMIYF